MILDVKKAFLYGKIARSVYIELPDEDPVSKTGNYVGKLRKAMYGTRDAPQVWQNEVKTTMKKLGFVGAVSTPCLYLHPVSGIRIVAHVDDFLCSDNLRTGMREKNNAIPHGPRKSKRTSASLSASLPCRSNVSLPVPPRITFANT